MNDDLIIHAEKLCKSYQLHTKPHERLFSLFRRSGSAGGRVHHALFDVDLEVRRGEKVGIIGRNGAGKSSLLKIITRAIEPTSGKLEVRGKSHALLQLGTGFHPDFTGRENAYLFLAHLGMSGKTADKLVEDAVTFAEVEEYVDQPLKTYSTGMAARLMFAVSTAIEPDLLVIDEVLGVGDAYFQNKSFERIRELCAVNGTTLLLVSHDVYSAAKLCDRMIWIDRGRIRADGGPTATLKLYEDSIRLQEDTRQKQKLALLYRSEAGRSDAPPTAFIEVRARNNEPPATPIHFAAMSLRWQNGDAIEFPILGSHDHSALHGHTVRLLPHLPWGSVAVVEGRSARTWNNFGAVDHKVGVALFADDSAQTLDDASLHLSLQTDGSIDADVVYIDASGAERILGRILPTPGTWNEFAFELTQGTLATQPLPATNLEANPVGRQGSGRLIATAFDLLGPNGETSFNLQHGQPATFTFEYRINDPSLDEHCQIVFVFKRNGIDDVARTIARHIRFCASDAREGRIEMKLDPVRLGTGTYTATLMIAAKDYYENSDGRFFSINPDVYDCRNVVLEFEVYERGSLLPQGTGYVADALWRQVESKSNVRSLTQASRASLP